MTIKRRINLSFVVVAVLFAANLAIYFWNSGKQAESADSLRRATRRQQTLNHIQQEVTSAQKQIALLSGGDIADKTGTAGASDVAQFLDVLHKISLQTHELASLADTDMRAQYTAFASKFDQLSASWGKFYQNFGVNNTVAQMELSLHGDDLSREVIQEMLPVLQAADRARADAATERFFLQADRSQQLDLAFFGISTLIAMLVGYLVLRYLVNGLNKLKEGAEQIGHVRLDYRIDMKQKDELGELAVAFNDMAEKLSTAGAELRLRNNELEEEKQHAETLLLNILPARAAKELREKGSVDPRYFEDVTIMFTDFVGFTLSTEKLAAEDLVHMLHDYFTAFDQISRRYGLEKLKTIGDSYMCLSGLPVRNPSHPVDVVMAAFEMVQAVDDRSHRENHPNWGVRVGIHTGPVVAGVVGIDKFAFDIWGDSVNFSSRMESSGAKNRINVSERTWSRVKDFFECEHRGKVQTKDKREVDMYFVNGLLPTLQDASGTCPPPLFVRRYRTYFEKEPPAFPDLLLVRK